MARAIICGKPEMKIGEIAIVATLISELPPATFRSTERRSLPPATLWRSELATCSL